MAKKRQPTPSLDPDQVKDVLRIRLDGAQLHDVVDYAREKGWTLTEADCQRLIDAADAVLVARMPTSRKVTLARQIAQRETLYARAVNGADYRTALAILADLGKLVGLYDSRRDRSELLKLVQAQQDRIEELEARLNEPRVLVASGENQTQPETTAQGTSGASQG